MPAKKPKQHGNSRFKVSYIREVKRWTAVNALTDSELARIFKVTEMTLRRWKVNSPAFAEACLISTTAANAQVELSLYKKAKGFWVDTEEIRVIDGVIVRVATQTYYPPDTAACAIWLKCKAGWHDGNATGLPGSGEAGVVSGPPAIGREEARRVLYFIHHASRDGGKSL
ncbi:MAG: hypothetical protein ACRDHG_09250 [Anaerolineales bacterium]